VGTEKLKYEHCRRSKTLQYNGKRLKRGCSSKELLLATKLAKQYYMQTFYPTDIFSYQSMMDTKPSFLIMVIASFSSHNLFLCHSPFLDKLFLKLC